MAKPAFFQTVRISSVRNAVSGLASHAMSLSMSPRPRSSALTAPIWSLNMYRKMKLAVASADDHRQVERRPQRHEPAQPGPHQQRETEAHRERRDCDDQRVEGRELECLDASACRSSRSM